MSLKTYAPLPTHDDSEDFFTKISFSTLFGELNCKDFLPTYFTPPPYPISNAVKVEKDIERFWSSKTDQEIINMILM